LVRMTERERERGTRAGPCVACKPPSQKPRPPFFLRLPIPDPATSLVSEVALAAAAAADLPTTIPSLAAALTLTAGGFAFRPTDLCAAVLRDGDAVSLDLATPPAARNSAGPPVAKAGAAAVEGGRGAPSSSDDEEGGGDDATTTTTTSATSATASGSSSDVEGNSGSDAPAGPSPATPAQGRKRPCPGTTAAPVGGPSRATRRRAARRAAGRGGGGTQQPALVPARRPELKGRVAAAAAGLQPGGHIRFGRGGGGDAGGAENTHGPATTAPLPPTGAPVATPGATSAHGARAGAVGGLRASLREGAWGGLGGQ